MSGGWAKILDIRFKGEGEVFNFSVANNNNYYVGNSRFLTHNTDCKTLAKRLRSRQGGEVLTVQNPNGIGFVEKPADMYPDYVNELWGYHSVHVNKKDMVKDTFSKFGKKRIPLSDWKKSWDNDWHEFIYEP